MTTYATTVAPRSAASPMPDAVPATRAADRSRVKRLFLGSDADPHWARPALWGLLLATAVMYLWNITVSGYANEFYAASVKSATQSWRAWLFASLDSQLSITVDKPPAAIWVMGLSARIFGFSSASLLIPQALMGVASVALVYGAVQRLTNHAAGLVAGALLMLTPVAALMFRFDNPDALLTLCLVAASYAVVRAVQATIGRRALGWMVFAGWLIGLAFLTKMLQGLVILPAIALMYLVASRFKIGTRLAHLAAAAASMIVSGGWLVALVAIWPASARPYIGGSTNNSLWELALGYNGLGRILGGEGNGGGGGGGMGGSANTGFGGAAGILRMFNAAFGTEVSWFLPAALILLMAGLVATARSPRTDAVRAGLIGFGGSMLITALVFSFMSGTIHPYYTVALAPFIAATVAIGGYTMISHSTGRWGVVWRGVLSLALIATGWWSFHLLNEYATSWLPGLRWIALAGGILGAFGWYAGGLTSKTSVRRAAAGLLVAGAIAVSAPSASWTVATAASAHSGSIPTSGPAVAGQNGMGGMGGMGGAMGQGGPGGSTSGSTGSTGTSGMTPPSGSTSGNTNSNSTSGNTTSGSASGNTSGSASGNANSGSASNGTSTSGSQTQSQQGPGGGMGGVSTSEALVTLLNNAGTKWSVAVVGDQTAAGLILNTNTAVYTIGGWSGSDNNVTLAQFKQLVAEGKIHYFIAGGQMGGGQGGGTSSASEISSWVTSTFKSTTVGGTTVYDLTTTA